MSRLTTVDVAGREIYGTGQWPDHIVITPDGYAQIIPSAVALDLSR